MKLVSFIIILFTSLPVNALVWTDIIRATPYRYSAGYHQKISTIRQWVLRQNSFCETPERHILFDDQGQFLGYIDNETSKPATQNKLNTTRQDYSDSKKVSQWIPGTSNSTGYPFALNCNQPHANIFDAINRLVGKDPEDRIWGTWDGMSAGTESKAIPLYQVVETVFKTRSRSINQPVVAKEFRFLLAQIIIESGAQKNGLSKEQAIGMLQLKKEVLNDCEIRPKFYRHRMAQVDCAVRLFQQNHRNLKPVFDKTFGHLPAEKQQTIFSMLLVQSYHSGIGRMIRLMSDESFNKAAKHFSNKASNYSAEDIAVGLIYHNLGRTDLGFASLYYVIDVAITAETICKTKELHDKWFC